MIYLDNAATTKPYPEVLDTVRSLSEQTYANPHALHSFGVSAERAVNEARKTLAEILDVLPSEIIFTSCGTEANNLALRGITLLPDRLGKHVVTTAMEHASVLEPFKYLESIGFETSFASLHRLSSGTPNRTMNESNNGTLNVSAIGTPNSIPNRIPNGYKQVKGDAPAHLNGLPSVDKQSDPEVFIPNLQSLCEQLVSLVRPDTRLISLMLVNNETGSIQAVANTVRACKNINPKVLVHVDAVQALGKIPVLPKELQADFVTFSAHKLNGPKGVGALYMRKGTRLAVQQLGGGQEGGMRSGTLNVPGICGFAQAAQMRTQLMEKNLHHVTSLRDALLNSITEALQEDVISLSPQNGSPYILLMSFQRMKAEVMLHHLAEKGIYVSSGSACSAKKQKSHVLLALNVPDKWQGGAIRFSFSSENTMDEIETTVREVVDIYHRIRY